jgi:hypothetical protein
MLGLNIPPLFLPKERADWTNYHIEEQPSKNPRSFRMSIEYAHGSNQKEWEKKTSHQVYDHDCLQIIFQKMQKHEMVE